MRVFLLFFLASTTLWADPCPSYLDGGFRRFLAGEADLVSVWARILETDAWKQLPSEKIQTMIDEKNPFLLVSEDVAEVALKKGLDAIAKALKARSAAEQESSIASMLSKLREDLVMRRRIHQNTAQTQNKISNARIKGDLPISLRNEGEEFERSIIQNFTAFNSKKDVRGTSSLDPNMISWVWSKDHEMWYFMARGMTGAVVRYRRVADLKPFGSQIVFWENNLTYRRMVTIGTFAGLNEGNAVSLLPWKKTPEGIEIMSQTDLSKLNQSASVPYGDADRSGRLVAWVVDVNGFSNGSPVSLGHQLQLGRVFEKNSQVPGEIVSTVKLTRIIDGAGPTKMIAVSPEGKHVAILRPNDEVAVLDITNFKHDEPSEIELFTPSRILNKDVKGIHEIKFLPGTGDILARTQNEVWRLRADGSRTLLFKTEGKLKSMSVGGGPSKVLAFIEDLRQAVLFEPQKGRVLRTLSDPSLGGEDALDPWLDAVLSLDGKTIATSDRSGVRFH